MAYGLFRMFYLKMPEYASGVYVYALDVLSVIMTIVALAPAALKFATIGRVVGRLQTFVDCASSAISVIGEFDHLTSKIVLFIQEVEVIHRGFTLYVCPVSSLTFITCAYFKNIFCYLDVMVCFAVAVLF